MIVLNNLLRTAGDWTKTQLRTACKQYCLAAGTTQSNIAYTQTFMGKPKELNDRNNETEN